MKPMYQKRSPLSVSAQAIGLRRSFPNGNVTLARDQIRWMGCLCPDEYGRTYGIELEYSLGSSPQVWVRNPDLRALAGERRLPHVYSQKEQKLCLFVPGARIWSPDLSLAFTVLPWAGYWLRLFEMWLVTDVWAERGAHP